MGTNTGVSWADHTFNPWIGCTKISAGCANCYAATEADQRYHLAKWGAGQPRRFTSAATWRNPKKWNREAREAGIQSRVFCASWSDVFDAEVPDEWRMQLFALIESTPNLIWMLLTKRAGEIVRRIPAGWLESGPHGSKWPGNVWIGTTVENQQAAKERLPFLVELPAPVRFVSAEPLLGPVDLSDWIGSIDWLIVGGESGRDFRAMEPGWAIDLWKQSQALESPVPFFFKQFSAMKPGFVGNGLFGDGELWQNFPN